MRQIKFRAWDERGAFVNNETGKAEPHMIRNVGISIKPGWINKEPEWFTDGGKLHIASNSDGFILMQFTGRRDINGKDIYEGDIVKTDQGLARVVYSELQMMFYLKGRFGPAEDEDSLEVVGNIYENPDWYKDQ